MHVKSGIAEGPQQKGTPCWETLKATTETGTCTLSHNSPCGPYLFSYLEITALKLLNSVRLLLANSPAPTSLGSCSSAAPSRVIGSLGLSKWVENGSHLTKSPDPRTLPKNPKPTQSGCCHFLFLYKLTLQA